MSEPTERTYTDEQGEDYVRLSPALFPDFDDVDSTTVVDVAPEPPPEPSTGTAPTPAAARRARAFEPLARS